MTDAAEAWRKHADDLVSAAWSLFASNYSDWIGFLPRGKQSEGKSFVHRSGSLNDSILRRHFVGNDGDLIGMPFQSTPSRMGIPVKFWLGFDIRPGMHGISDAHVTWSAASRLEGQMRDVGVTPLLEEYDSAGNYHLWVLPDGSSLEDWDGGPSPHMGIRWSTAMVRHARLPLECIAQVLPLPGRHHTVEHWSRFRAGDRWVEGEEAVSLLLNWPAIPVQKFGAQLHTQLGDA